ncbi:hypothetical protein E2C01_065543 [Portunus trituberculatus]|uniref:Uncharacterized protein n=1 Tax=Portunus trituberculatus TaxID=210409 RepID=A0A5B7HEV8_PORTR|nr:hypothetical protein [Portunus trituberculatus]
MAFVGGGWQTAARRLDGNSDWWEAWGCGAGQRGGAEVGAGGRAAPRRHQTCQLPLEVEGRPAHPAHLHPSLAPTFPASP